MEGWGPVQRSLLYHKDFPFFSLFHRKKADACEIPMSLKSHVSSQASCCWSSTVAGWYIMFEEVRSDSKSFWERTIGVLLRPVVNKRVSVVYVTHGWTRLHAVPYFKWRFGTESQECKHSVVLLWQEEVFVVLKRRRRGGWGGQKADVECYIITMILKKKHF